MRQFQVMAITLALAPVLMNGAQAQEDSDAKAAAASPAASTNADDLAAIRKSVETFKAAFDAGKAEEVAAHWTVDGELIDESGRRLQGREAIAKAYADFFAAHPGIQLQSHTNNVKFLSADTAIEDGTTSTDPAPAGAPVTSKYSAVHVKQQDGTWLMGSVRETTVPTPSNYAHLEDLEWLVGTWATENAGITFQLTSRWTANKNYLEQSFKATRDGEEVSSGTTLIGWDAASRQLKSWTFTSDGGHSTGSWSPEANGWVIEAVGTTIDGTPTTAVNILTALDNNAFSWRSVNRSAGAFRVADTEEVILRRKAANSN